MKRSRISIFGVTGLLLATLTVPVATALLDASVGGHYSDTLKEQALGNQPELRSLRRALTRLNARCNKPNEVQDNACKAYVIVQEECFARQNRYFQDTGCPTINDMVRIDEVQNALDSKEAVPALPGSSSSSLSSVSAHAAAVSSSATKFDDLSTKDQNAIRQAVRVKYCSIKLPQALYLICSALVGEHQQDAPMGLGNDLQGIQAARHSAQSATLKDRIEMTKPLAK